MASGSSSIVSLKLRRSLPVHARFPGCFHHDHGDQWKRGMINDRGFKFHRGFGVFALKGKPVQNVGSKKTMGRRAHWPHRLSSEPGSPGPGTETNCQGSIFIRYMPYNLRRKDGKDT